MTDNEQSLPNGWINVKINEICNLVNGRAFKPSDWSDKGLPIVRIQNLNKEDSEFNFCNFDVEDKYLIETDQLLFAWSGTPGTSFGAHIWKGGKAVLNQHIFKVEIDEKYLNKKYLMYAFNTNLDEYIGKAHGTAGLAHITKGKFENSYVPLPPLAEQHRIVAKIEELFTKLDAGVESLKKAKAQLKQYRQAVLRDAFEGKLTEEWRHKVQENTIDWTWTRVKEISEFIQYGTSEKTNEDSTGIPVIRMGNIQNGKIIFDNLKYLPRNLNDLNNVLLEDGDLLFNRTNSAELVGKSAVYKKEYPSAAFASYLIRVRTNKLVYNPYFLSYYINSIGGRDYIKSVVSQQVGQANVNGTKLAAMPIPYPSIDEQNMIIEKIEGNISSADHLENEIDTAINKSKKLKQNILKLAFQGKLVPQDSSDEPAIKTFK